MYYRFFGQRNPEKDIERILVDLQGSGGVCYWTYVDYNNYYTYGATYSNNTTSIALGGGHSATDGDFIYQFGLNHDADTGFGIFQALEGNQTITAGIDYPVYCAQIGILNEMEGDIFDCFQFGESNYMTNAGGSELNWNSAQFGYANYHNNAYCVYSFGRNTDSYLPSNSGYYNGRIILNGDAQQDFPSGSEQYGFNQASWFSQNMKVTTWETTWTTGRFEFPIISDSIWYFRAYIAGIEQGAANSYAWSIEGVVENDGGTTSILTSTVTNVYRDVTTKEWQVVADDTNDRLAFQYRDTAGQDTTDCNIQFSMHTVEVGWD